jgi:hypothetical protein
MSKKSPNTHQPAELAGLVPENYATAQQAVPAPYFAGVAKLKLLWLMAPVDQFTKKSKGTPSKK